MRSARSARGDQSEVALLMLGLLIVVMLGFPFAFTLMRSFLLIVFFAMFLVYQFTSLALWLPQAFYGR